MIHVSKTEKCYILYNSSYLDMVVDDTPSPEHIYPDDSRYDLAECLFNRELSMCSMRAALIRAGIPIMESWNN